MADGETAKPDAQPDPGREPRDDAAADPTAIATAQAGDSAASAPAEDAEPAADEQASATGEAAKAGAETPLPANESPASVPEPSPAAAPAPEPAPAGEPTSRLRRLAAGVVRLVDDPILLKELRAAFRRRRFLIALTSLLSITALALLIAIFALTDTRDGRPDPTQIGRTVFLAFSAVQAIVTFLVFPAFSCMTITEERANRSFDLLVTTCLPAWRIVLGKFLASFVYCVTFMAATLPLVSLAFLFGGVTPLEIGVAYLAQAVAAALVTAFALFASSVCGTTARAIMLTYLGMWPFYAVIFGPLGSIVYYLIIAPLTGDQEILTTIEGYSVANKAILFVVPIVGLAFVFVLFFLLAVNRLKPASANKSTALRVLYVLFVLFALGAVLAGAEASSEALGMDELGPPTAVEIKTKGTTKEARAAFEALAAVRSGHARSVMLGLMLVLVAGAIVFSGEDPDVPKRVRERMARLRGPGKALALFLPGDRNGVRFMTWLTLLTVTATTAYLILRAGVDGDAAVGWRPAGIAVRWYAIWTIVFVIFVAQLGHFLAPIIRHGIYTRLWIVFPLIAATIYPVFVFMIGAHDVPSRFYHAFYLSPALVTHSAWSEPYKWSAHARSLYMSGPTSNEIRAVRDELDRKASAERPTPAPAPLGRRDDASMQRIDEQVLVLARSGVSIHAVSVAVYALLAVVLALWNGVIRRTPAPAPVSPPAAAAAAAPAPKPEEAEA